MSSVRKLAICFSLPQVTEGLLLSHSTEILSFPLFLKSNSQAERGGGRVFWMFIARTSHRKLFAFFINFLTISRDLLSRRCNMLKSFPIKCHLKWRSERNFKKGHRCGRLLERDGPDQPCTVWLCPKPCKSQSLLKLKYNVLKYSDWSMC